MSDNTQFGKFVPGFDFLQGLVSQAGSAMPGIGQWIAPTLNPEEIEKRINELRTIVFWLEQNNRMLGATIQALEVQRMTLSTLKTMNVHMEDLRESLKIKTPPAPPSKPSLFDWPSSAPVTSKGSDTAGAASSSKSRDDKVGADNGATPTPAAPGVDPLQWWGTLTQQFTQLAAAALKQSQLDGSKDAADASGSASASANPSASSAQANFSSAAAPSKVSSSVDRPQDSITAKISEPKKPAIRLKEKGSDKSDKSDNKEGSRLTSKLRPSS